MAIALTSGTNRVVLRSQDNALTVSTVVQGPQVKRYTTEAELLAASPADGTIAYALDTDTHFYRQAGTWTEAATATSEVGVSDDTPEAVGTASAGTSGEASRSDHVHTHGTQLGGTLHAEVGASAGFMSTVDKAKLNTVAASAAALTSSAPAGVGTSPTVGVATTAARADHVHAHGAQTDGTLHAAVVAAGASGFMTGADKTKLDGVAASAAALTSSAPADVDTTVAVVGVASTAARADHKHDVSTAAASGEAGPAATNGEGSSSSLARADHAHAVTGVPLATEGSMTISCDPTSLVTSITGRWTKQAHADAAGASFKYLKDIWAALPDVVLPGHVITINMLTGVHRPRAGDTSIAWDLRDKIVMTAGQILIQGVAPSTSAWTTIVATQTVTANQAASDDPFIDVAGTPFAGLDLKGYFAVLSSGQTAIIHDHTNSRLSLCANITPALTNGVSTVTVMVPSTEMRNSTDDINTKAQTMVSMSAGPVQTVSSGLQILNVRFNPFGLNSTGVRTLNGRALLTRCLYDLTLAEVTYGKVADGFAFSNITGGSLLLSECSVRDQSNTSDGSVNVQGAGGAGALQVSRCYISGGHEPSSASTNATLTVINSVFDRCGSAVGSSIKCSVLLYGSIITNDFSGGKRSEIRNAPTGCAGLLISGAEASVNTANSSFRLGFKSNSGPCVALEEGATVVITDVLGGNFAGLYDGGGNLDVGIELRGGASVAIATETTVTGALGTVRMGDGSLISAWSDIVVGGVASDWYGNSVRRLA